MGWLLTGLEGKCTEKHFDYIFKLKKKSSFIAPVRNLLADSLLFDSFEM